ncbi:MAG TPA: RES family NAD+ phosphorylase [Acidobacteriaceae bacterium]|nr:RES family NAD+ phosphorylase [Acidobacteriaceae bacterium]
MALLEQFDQAGTHRLIPARLADKAGASVLETLPLPADVLADLSELDAATNERKVSERGANPAIGPGELLLGVPEADIVNAAFTHPGPFGGRFHSAQRGAWYAGFELETSIAEVAFHRRRFLANARIQGPLVFDYVEFLADFSASFHTLAAAERKDCLQPEPIPQCYASSQALATRLLFEGSNGIVYPSVRRPSGTCIACFRPALVYHPRRSQHLRLTLDAGTGTVACETLTPGPSTPRPRPSSRPARKKRP